MGVALDYGKRDGREGEVPPDRRIDGQGFDAVARPLYHASPARSVGDRRQGSSRRGTPVVIPWYPESGSPRTAPDGVRW